MTIKFTGTCGECGEPIGLKLKPTDNAIDALLPSPNRIKDMFDIEAKCADCGEWTEPDNLMAVQ